MDYAYSMESIKCNPKYHQFVWCINLFSKKIFAHKNIFVNG